MNPTALSERCQSAAASDGTDLAGQTSLLSPDRLHPNPYNPNRMTEDKYGELLAEVRHLGRLPKPIIVRRNEDGFEIIDGEHGWRAANDAGLTEVPCEIIDADDFEARRQTYKRNQHGTHNRVLEGRLFRDMCRLRGLSKRELAKEVEVSEGTIRNSILWADAADLRNGYAPGEDPVFEDMGVRDLRMYIILPTPIRDAWVDSREGLAALKAFDVFEPDQITAYFQKVIELGMGPAIKPHVFTERLKWAGDILKWRDDYGIWLDHFDEYLPAIVDRCLPVEALDWLPARLVEQKGTILVSPEDWERMLRHCWSRPADDDEERFKMLGASIRLTMQEKGIPAEDMQDPRNIERLASLRTAPDFIRDADFLNLTEKIFLAEVPADAPGLEPRMSEEEFLKLKREVCDIMLRRHRYLTDQDDALNRADPEIRAKLKNTFRAQNVLDVFHSVFSEWAFRQRIEERDTLFADRTLMLDEMTTEFQKLHSLRCGLVGGRPAMEVIRERLEKLELPELVLIAGYVLKGKHEAHPGQFWFNEIGGEIPDQAGSTEAGDQ